MKIGELFLDLFVKADQTKLVDFIHNLGDLKMSSLFAGLGLEKLYESIAHIMDVGDKTAMSIYNFGKTTGQSTQEFQKWSKFATQMGLDAQAIGSSVAGLEDQVMRMKLTGEGANAWNIIGIDPRGVGDMFTLLGLIRDKIKDLPKETQRFMLQNLGLSAELLKIIDTTDEQWADINRQITNTNAEVARLAEYHKTINKLTGDWNTFLTDLAATFAPILDFVINIADWIVRFVHDHHEWFSVLSSVAAIFVAVAGFLNPIIAGIWVLLNLSGVIHEHWQGISEFISNIIKMLTGMPKVSLMDIGKALSGANFAGQEMANLFNPKYEGQNTNGPTTNHNALTVHVNGGNPENIVQEIDRWWQRTLGNTEYQTALENN